MTLTYVKPFSSPNKPGGKKLYQIGYFPEGQKKRWVSVPKIDRLTAVFLPVSNKDHCKGIRELLLNDLKMGKDASVIEAPHERRLGSLYRINLELLVPSYPSAAFLYAEPVKTATKHYLRLDLNPSKLGPMGLDAFRGAFAWLFGDGVTYDVGVLQHGAITRIDVAVDIIHCRLKDLLVLSTKDKKCLAYFGEAGEPQSIYFGSDEWKKENSDHYAYEQGPKKIAKNRASGKTDPPSVRLECRLQTNQLKFANLKKYSAKIKPLSWFRVIDIGNVEPPLPAPWWGHFIEACRYGALETELPTLNDIQRKCVEKALESGAAIWRPEELWKYWGPVVDELGLLSTKKTLLP